MKRRAAILWGALAATAACGESGPNLALGEPKSFRLARPHDGLDIGIDLELRAPAGYDFFPESFDGHWHRNNDPTIRVTTDARQQATFELPCGELKYDATIGTAVVVSRTGQPDDLTAVCERRSNDNHVKDLWTVRLIRSIDDIIECRVTTVLEPHHTAKYRDPIVAICGSLRVLGRSPYDDWDVKEIRSGKY